VADCPPLMGADLAAQIPEPPQSTPAEQTSVADVAKQANGVDVALHVQHPSCVACRSGSHATVCPAVIGRLQPGHWLAYLAGNVRGCSARSAASRFSRPLQIVQASTGPSPWMHSSLTTARPP